MGGLQSTLLESLRKSVVQQIVHPTAASDVFAMPGVAVQDPALQESLWLGGWVVGRMCVCVGGYPLAPAGGDVMARAGCYRDTEEGLLTV